MFVSHSKKILTFFGLFALLLSACGAKPQSQDQISTAVAQTVQAQDSLTKVSSLPTLTPAPPLNGAPTSTADVITLNTAPVGAPGCTVSAKLVSETPPDATLFRPGEYFWKTWSLENTGTCAWDSTYKLIYSSGDLMGGLASYPLPEPVAPGQTKNISIYLKAPDTEGTFAGYWLIQTPWNATFGVGDNSPFYVQIAVSNAKKPKYEITSVTYTLTRDPQTGCPTNVRYTVSATITTNGPLEIDYYWDQKDGNHSGLRHLSFTAAGSQTLSRVWQVGKGDSPNPRWMQIIVTYPKRIEFDRFVFPNNCP